MTNLLPKNYEFSSIESKLRQYWQLLKVYQWQENESRQNTFVVDTPPPTVSGQLHIGHIFSYCHADFIVRFKRMTGKNIFYPIGFDDNGLPTERLVEKQRNILSSQISRQEFINLCHEVIEHEEEKFRQIWQKIALSVDWKLEYKTISPLVCKISQLSFLDLIAKGQIYRAQQPVLWDSIDQTALAQAEIEDKTKSTIMHEILFQTIQKENLIIATTRPEMLPACVAIFFNPEDQRYQHLINQFAITPLYEVKVPILSDSKVSIDKGTGLVMCCTFGDTTDVAWWQDHKLPLRLILDKKGKIKPVEDWQNNQMPSQAYEIISQIIGLSVSAARQKTLELLEAKNLLGKQIQLTHTVKCAERSGAPLEILTTQQWFIKSLTHKEDLLKQSNNLKWHPLSMKIKLDTWINNLSWDWCISRQRVFGIPFPVWYSKRLGEEGRVISADPKQLPVDPLIDLPDGYSKEEIEPDLDVMDTWATSCLSPQINSRAITKNLAIDQERHSKLFPADLRVQAHEIIRSWTFGTMLKSYLHDNILPWQNIMISGWCLAEDKTKMSKSKENVITPEKLLDQYGADVVRYWSSTAKLGANIVYSEEVMLNGKKLVNKIWNAAKFIKLHIQGITNNVPTIEKAIEQKQVQCAADLWLLDRLAKVIEFSTSYMHNYEYSMARELIENWFWRDYCGNYLELIKVRVYNKDNKYNQARQDSGRLTLYYSLSILLKLFAPFLPYITEELYQLLFNGSAASRSDKHHYSETSIHQRHMWPKPLELFKYHPLCLATSQAITILELVHKAKAEQNLSVKAEIEELYFYTEEKLIWPDDLLEDLKNVTNAKNIYCDLPLTKDINVLKSSDAKVMAKVVFKFDKIKEEIVPRS